jgi:uncharacterized membrane protein
LIDLALQTNLAGMQLTKKEQRQSLSALLAANKSKLKIKKERERRRKAISHRKFIALSGGKSSSSRTDKFLSV